MKLVAKKSCVTSFSKKDNIMRLNRFLSMAGIASRRKADKLISERRISINGKIVTALGTQVDIGRLDFDTEGVLFFTNDGKLTHRLLHPKYKVKKTYFVEVEGVPTDDTLERLRNGINLEDGMTAPAQIDLIEKYKKTTLLRFVIYEGRKRQVRRMCEAVGHSVVHLKRTHFDKFHLGNLKPGEYRRLNKMEVNYLRRLVGLNI